MSSAADRGEKRVHGGDDHQGGAHGREKKAKHGEVRSGLLAEVGRRLEMTWTPDTILGREQEVARVDSFLRASISDASAPHSIYLSGAPGTGKTLCVTDLAATFEREHKSGQWIVKVLYVNAMALNKPRQIYQAIFDELRRVGGSSVRAPTGKGVEELQDCLRGHFLGSSSRFVGVGINCVYVCVAFCLSCVFFSLPPNSNNFVNNRSKKRFVLIVDEMDQLLGNVVDSRSASDDQAVLYGLFDWPTCSGSCLTLVGIANEVSLLDRFLPRLEKQGMVPDNVVFQTYNELQIKAIISQRLQVEQPQEGKAPLSSSLSSTPSGPTTPLFAKSVLALCSKKLAKSGDIRKALQICRQCVAAVESDNSSSSSSSTAQAPTVSFGQMASMFKASESAWIQIIAMLPTEQKFMLCVFVIIFARFRLKKKPLTLEKFTLGFRFLKSKKDRIGFPSTLSEGLVHELVGPGLLGLSGSRKSKPNARKFSMNVEVTDIRRALKENAFFTNLLDVAQDEGALQWPAKLC
jgi:cell division control protein 6